MINIGESIVYLRKHHGLMQKELAKALGVRATYLSQVENNVQRPSMQLLQNIASYFSVSVYDLFFTYNSTLSVSEWMQVKSAKPVVEVLLNYFS